MVKVATLCLSIAKTTSADYNSDACFVEEPRLPFHFQNVRKWENLVGSSSFDKVRVTPIFALPFISKRLMFIVLKI